MFNLLCLLHDFRTTATTPERKTNANSTINFVPLTLYASGCVCGWTLAQREVMRAGRVFVGEVVFRRGREGVSPPLGSIVIGNKCTMQTDGQVPN